MNKLYDLHIHSTYSDGKSTPIEILKYVKEKNIKYFSITDHDNCDAYTKEFIKLTDSSDITLIKGIEITSKYKDNIIEILGYNIDTDKMNRLLKKELKINTKESKNIIFKNFLTMLKRNNIEIKKEIYNINIDNETIYDYLKDNTAIDIPHNVFIRKHLYNPKSNFFIDFTFLYPTIETVLKIIKDCGGLSFLPHCFHYFNIDYKDILSDYKFDGIEAIYPSYSPKQINDILIFSKKNSLLNSLGSDFHKKEDYIYQDKLLNSDFSNLNLSWIQNKER